MIDINKLWAKIYPFVSLCDHCEEVGKIAGLLWDLGIIDKSLITRDNLCFLASLHDIGKCYPDFQKNGLGIIPYIDQLKDEGYLPLADHRYRHEIGTESILLLRHRNDFANRKIAVAAAKVLRLHHQKTSDNYLSPSPKEKDWCEAQDALIAEMECRFNKKLKDINFEISDTVCVRLWGVIVLADWLASGGLGEAVLDMFQVRPFSDADYKKMFNLDTLRPLQKQCKTLVDTFDERIPSAIIIEAPMGEGKTEAALYLAAQFIKHTNKIGFYIALPTMATARQMEGRTTRMLTNIGLPPAILVHSNAWLEQDRQWGDEVDLSWFTPTKRALLSSYAVGTVDQGMMSVLKIKQGVLRLLGLSNKVLIVDEMHAYDTYMQTILYRLMEWCAAMNIPVIMLSATLPKERKGKILDAYQCRYDSLSDAYPLITSVYKDGTVTEIPVGGTYINRKIKVDNTVFYGVCNVAQKAVDAIKDGGCAAIIMNTVKDAQDVYSECKALAGADVFLMLFHARFLAKDRKTIEDECLSRFGKNSEARPHKAILVATQVVEQSLDVDFDVMFSALAPIDLLLQRSGRLHRHNRIRLEAVKEPVFFVFVNDENTELPGIGKIYEPWTIAKTQEVLTEVKEISIPNDIRPLIEAVYGLGPRASEERFELWIKKKSAEAVMEGRAKDIRFPAPSTDWFFPLESDGFFLEETDDCLVSSDAVTRLGGDNVKIAVLPKEIYDEKRLEAPDISYAKLVSEYSVSITTPRECSLQTGKGVFPCGGYLKGVWAIAAENTFSLPFGNNRISRLKKYSVDSEYGIKEEE